MANARKPRAPRQQPGKVETAPDSAAPVFTLRSLLESAARAKRGMSGPQGQAFDKLFTPYEPFPGVFPDAKPLKLAQDAAPIAASAWANQAVYNGAFFEGVTFLGYAFLSELAQRPEFRVMSETIASEMTREWIDIKSTGEDKSEKIKKITDRFEDLNVKQVFAKAAAHDGFFGRGHIYLDTGDTDDRPELKQPIGDGRNLISKEKVSTKKPLLALRNVEPVWTYPTQYDSNDPLKPDWYHPTTWFVMGKEVHRTRLFTFIGREVPDLLKPSYAFGGLSMSQMAQPYVNNWLKIRQSIADLIQAFSVMVLKTDLQALMQLGGEQLFGRIELFNLLRQNNGVMALNKDSEEFDNVSAPLSGLEALQAQSQEHMAAVSRIPLVKLLGIQPAGLNASSDGEIRAFYDWIAAFQELLFRDHLTTILWFVQLSLFDEVDPEITFEFKPLWQLDEAAAAAVEKTKTDIDDANVAMGSISPDEVRKRLADDPHSIYSGLDLSAPAPGPQMEEEDILGEQNAMGEPAPGAPTTAGKPRDLRDNSEASAARAGNLNSTLGGTGGDAEEDAPVQQFKEAVDFEHPAKGPHHCGQCEHFLADERGCELVAGIITAPDWCKLFKADTRARMDLAQAAE